MEKTRATTGESGVFPEGKKKLSHFSGRCMVKSQMFCYTKTIRPDTIYQEELV